MCLRGTFLRWFLVLWGLFLPVWSWALSDDELMGLSLEELINLEVSSVSKKLQKVTDSAAAVFVITQDDIRRSGATSIPEALRLAPGITVARIDGSKWAISCRGFNGRYANKLLVLIDGRSVYSPFFSGVYWDVQDTLLDDVERIEVIRGPGATLWGANAVNGVINVITKNSRDTQGVSAKVGYGTEDEGFAAVRFGGRTAEKLYYRGFVKYFNRDRLGGGDGEAHDDWNAFRGGFRMDGTPTTRDDFTLHGEAYSGTAGQSDLIYELNPAINNQRLLVSDTRFSGSHILARWHHTLEDDDDLSLQIYYDHTFRDEEALVKERRDTLDIDFQHRLNPSEHHEILWGGGYRLTADHIEDGLLISVEDEKRTDHLFSLFVQDEITLVHDRLRLLIGSKFEHNDYTGFEYQPNARLIWTPNEHHSLWGAFSRAVRTPSRLEDSGDIHYGIMLSPLTSSPTKLVIKGSSDYESEDSLSYELGYRYFPTKTFSLDTALFYVVYSDHRSWQMGASEPVAGPIPYVYQIVEQANYLKAETYGIEVSTDWHPFEWCRLQATYTFLKVDTRAEPGNTDILSGLVYEESSPQQQVSLRSSIDMGDAWELDVWLRYVDRLKVTYTDIDDYVGLDLRVAWKPVSELELALIGQNLLQSHHQEFQTEMGTVPSEIPRGFYAQMTWKY